ncbi:unnamed protein product [Vicia faba]|uniref:MsrB domain-containing protein n=1 Tax=Vicia faba TaxID=3906 RepID=A0AAV0Z1X8_VICFA|nr:unnamed protein product [Vicia faba]
MASTTMPIEKSEKEWRAILFPEQFRIPLLKGTELKSTTKFDSGCGWPTFFEGFSGAINRFPDLDGRRIEITCATSSVHLAHVFKGEGFKVPMDERHCVNSVSVKFIPGNVASSI